MTELKIKFSHDSYLKFMLKDSVVENEDIVSLVGVSVCEANKLPPDFLAFDTNYGTEDAPEYFELPKGKVLVLFFFVDGDFFSTIRRHTVEKERYYSQNIGNDFEVVIE